MWQCSTYPGPCVGSNGKRFWPGPPWVVATCCGVQRTAMRVISPGKVLMVSFQPESRASGARGGHAPPAQAPCERYFAVSKLRLPPTAPAEFGTSYGRGGPKPGMNRPGGKLNPLKVP